MNLFLMRNGIRLADVDQRPFEETLWYVAQLLEEHEQADLPPVPPGSQLYPVEP